MDIKKSEIIIGILAILCILYKIYLYIFYIDYITTTVTIFFLISTFIFHIFYLFYFFMIIPLKSHKINSMRAELALKIRKHNSIITYSIVILYLFEFYMIEIVYGYVKEYLDNCPFFLTDDLNKHHKRRCELYNVNHNSRYSYQNISSFDPSGSFKYETETHFLYDKKIEKKLRKKIMSDYIRCLHLNSLIKDNEVISLFANEYKNSKNYYCSRTNKPEKNYLISDKNCKNQTKVIFIILMTIFEIIQFFLKIIIPIVIGKKNPGFNDHNDYNDYNTNINIRNRNNNNNYNYNNNNNINFNNIINNNDNNNNNNYNGNDTNNHLDSTIISDVNYNENFEEKNAKNIIIENGKELPINTDIQNINFDNIDNEEINDSINIANKDIELKNENEVKEKTIYENNLISNEIINSMNNNVQINEGKEIMKDDEKNNKETINQINNSKELIENNNIEKDNENKSEIIINNNEDNKMENNMENNEKENDNNKRDKSLLNKLFEEFEGERLSSTIKHNKSLNIEKDELKHGKNNTNIPEDTKPENDEKEEDKKDNSKMPEDTKIPNSEDNDDDNN